MSASWVTFLFEAANFLLLAAVLGWAFFQPVRNALERRRRELESERRDAEEAMAEADRVLRDARSRRVELEGSLEELRERARRQAEVESERLIEAARMQAQRERKILKEELVSARRGQARTQKRDAAFAAREVVASLLERIDGPDLEGSLLQVACRELEKLRSSGALAPIVVESVRPLDSSTVARFAAAAGVAVSDATNRVDPDLVAGVRVITSRGLLDVSAAGLAAQTERELVLELDRNDSEHA